VLLRLPLQRKIPKLYHGWCRALFGLHVELRGTICRNRPVLFTSNHSSYLDIMVLGSLVQASFVAKSEIAGWPLFGWLARLQRSVFVDRRPTQAAAHKDEIQRRLEQRDNLILFPEGTSSDGNRVLPFKSALFAVAQTRVHARDRLGRKGPEQPITIQPVSITAARLDGMPLGRTLRPLYAWYGDMDLASHIWHLASLGRVTVVVEFHPPFQPAETDSRKALAEHCWNDVARGVSAVVTGRSSHEEPVARTDHSDDEHDEHEHEDHNDEPGTVHAAA
jgi:1-acyl-sn-glycerol-3-phosphate acyltransferase